MSSWTEICTWSFWRFTFMAHRNQVAIAFQWRGKHR